MNDERRPAIVLCAPTFEARLVDIERYWHRVGHPESFDRLSALIDDKLVPLLARFPAIGRHFLSLVDEMLGPMDRAALREVVFDDYVVLYRFTEETVELLTLRHTKETLFKLPEQSIP
ncbi:type II toxin-antitoxin system RelE/ParE family toxin [Caballeronia sp. BR00000012568055]|uniref:type II toxin-antitoxin system RelE/ParE family toxin n=1 Tax=Caballeronia sp. BR00000012568055 TaxID=2918761 RepID=UPI0023F74655